MRFKPKTNYKMLPFLEWRGKSAAYKAVLKDNNVDFHKIVLFKEYST
jgi:hypothetical protein